eukprot:COSAG06_NODE_17_length_34906_cov_31.908268_48_plen_129_part_00
MRVHTVMLAHRIVGAPYELRLRGRPLLRTFSPATVAEGITVIPGRGGAIVKLAFVGKWLVYEGAHEPIEPRASSHHLTLPHSAVLWPGGECLGMGAPYPTYGTTDPHRTPTTGVHPRPCPAQDAPDDG